MITENLIECVKESLENRKQGYVKFEIKPDYITKLADVCGALLGILKMENKELYEITMDYLNGGWENKNI